MLFEFLIKMLNFFHATLKYFYLQIESKKSYLILQIFKRSKIFSSYKNVLQTFLNKKCYIFRVAKKPGNLEFDNLGKTKTWNFLEK